MFVQIFHHDRAELMEEALDSPIVSVQVATILNRYEQPIGLLTELSEVRGVVMAIPENEAGFSGILGVDNRLDAVHLSQHMALLAARTPPETTPRDEFAASSELARL